MSWDQDYAVASYGELLSQLTKKNEVELLEAELERQGLKVVSTERVLLTEGMYEDVYGFRVTLSDGRVFIPKLVERFTSDGNYGRDLYQWRLESETPEVKYINEDSDYNDPQIEPGLDDDTWGNEGGYSGGDEGCGCGF